MTSQTRERIGFVGLGNMGGPLAERLLLSGPVTVYDTSADRIAAHVAKGAVAAESLADVARRSDVVFTCLPSSKEVRAVLTGADGLAAHLQEGALVADMTTGDPGATREMAETVRERGLTLIDAPVSGGPRGAREGTIAIMVGAGDAEFARVSPILRRISSNVLHAGAVGAGHAVKAGNNLLNLICRMATFEVVSLLVKDGVAPETAVAIIQKSSGRNYATEITLPDNILSGKMHQGFTMALMHKDSSVALDIAERLGLPMPFGEEARARLDAAIAAHGAQADMSTVALLYEELTDARIRP